MGVGDQLHLDVARPGEEALDVDLGPAEGRLRLAAGGGERLGDIVGPGEHAHAAAAAAVDGLDGERPAELLAERDDRVGVLHRDGRPGNERHARVVAQPALAASLSPISAITSADGPTQVNRRRDRGGEVGALGEESVTGVDRVAPRRPRRRRRRGRRRGRSRPAPTRRSRPRRRPARRRATRRRVRCAPPPPACRAVARADHPDGDLAPVGDEDPRDHPSVLSATARQTSARSDVRPIDRPVEGGHDVLTEQTHGPEPIGARAAVRTTRDAPRRRRGTASVHDVGSGAADAERQHLRWQESDGSSRSSDRERGQGRGIDADAGQDLGANDAPKYTSFSASGRAATRRVVVDRHPDAGRHVDIVGRRAAGGA